MGTRIVELTQEQLKELTDTGSVTVPIKDQAHPLPEREGFDLHVTLVADR
ncbi:hypothetical protein [Cellulomonas sp. HZM]|nr:hypothetical protein [Cellulomonas sp. HZM]